MEHTAVYSIKQSNMYLHYFFIICKLLSIAQSVMHHYSLALVFLGAIYRPPVGMSSMLKAVKSVAKIA